VRPQKNGGWKSSIRSLLPPEDRAQIDAGLNDLADLIKPNHNRKENCIVSEHFRSIRELDSGAQLGYFESSKYGNKLAIMVLYPHNASSVTEWLDGVLAQGGPGTTLARCPDLEPFPILHSRGRYQPMRTKTQCHECRRITAGCRHVLKGPGASLDPGSQRTDRGGAETRGVWKVDTTYLAR